MKDAKINRNIAIALAIGLVLIVAIIVGVYFAIGHADEEGCLGWMVFAFDIMSGLVLIGYIVLIAIKLRLVRINALKWAIEIIDVYGFAAFVATGIITIIGLVTLCISPGAVSIASFITAIVLCLVYAMLFFAMRGLKEVKAESIFAIKATKQPKAEKPKKEQPKVEEKVEEPKEEKPVEQPVVEEYVEQPIIGVPQEEDTQEYYQEEYEGDDEDDDDEEIIVSDYHGNIFRIQYNKSFTAKLAQAPDYIKQYYSELKNEMLSYKKTTSRVSWFYDSINLKRKQLVKFSIRGKTLCVYYALNADDFKDTSYLVEKVETKKFETVPCIYRIKNDLRLRHAKELMTILAEQEGLQLGERKNEDYYIKYETTQALINKELIKELRMPATEEELAKAKRKKIKQLKSVTVQQANELVNNEEAQEAIIDHRSGKYTGKKDIINIDVLSRNYNDGDTVTIESLKEKKLIDKSIGQVKVLARGVLDKRLNVELQDFSLEAVKMILLTGGTVTEV